MIWICTVGAALEITIFGYIAVELHRAKKDSIYARQHERMRLDSIESKLDDLKSEMADAKEDESKQNKMDEGFQNLMSFDPTNVGLDV